MKSKSLKQIWSFLGIFLLLLLVSYFWFIFPRPEQQDQAAEVLPRLENTITIIEGWNNEQIASYLQDFGPVLAASGQDLVAFKVKDFKDDYEFLADAPAKAGLEGYLFPDTYRVYSSSSPEELAIKMLSNLDNKLTQAMRDDIIASGHSVYEIMTMASLIEKEVIASTDMAIVSGIFWQRIEAGQALQSCATLAYILGENKAQYSYEETRTPSDYNTYLHQGLPPGPIANPGLEAIKAAIYPKKTNYNYFLSDPATNQTIYSRTYEEHLTNKNKYLK